jgi:hypothetical protein
VRPEPVPSPSFRPPSVAEDEKAQADRRQRIILGTVIPLFLALSLLLSFNWVQGGFYPNVSTNILLAVLGSSLVYLGLVLSRFFAFRRSCPGCGRGISFEAEACPYCGRRLG